MVHPLELFGLCRMRFGALASFGASDFDPRGNRRNRVLILGFAWHASALSFTFRQYRACMRVMEARVGGSVLSCETIRKAAGA
jgi:hypothetical protein